MGSSPPTSQKRRRHQSRLTFEPVAGSSSPSSGLSPARVKYQTRGGGGDGSRPTQSLTMPRPKKSGPKQQTLESSLGRSKATRHPDELEGKKAQISDDDVLPFSMDNGVKTRRPKADPPPPSSFIPKPRTGARRIVSSDSESSVEEDGGVDDSDGESPLKMEVPRRRARRAREPPSDPRTLGPTDNGGELRSSQSVAFSAAAEDSDDVPLATPMPSHHPRKSSRKVVLDDDDDADGRDELDQLSDDGQTPAKRRRLVRRAPTSPDESDEELVVVAEDEPQTPTKGISRGSGTMYTPIKIGARKGARTEKQKKMEFLRRRRAGENITMEDLDSDSEEAKGALYDTDSEAPALDEFPDEEESPDDNEPVSNKSDKSKKRREERGKKAKSSKKRTPDEIEEDSEDLDDFVVEDEDEDGNLGVPDHLLRQEIPLEFTMASRKPLKEHFKDAIEWLVHRRINPTFDRDDQIYRLAWRRLDDEVTGLAQSKFISTVWKPDFIRVLRARPYIEQNELGVGYIPGDLDVCQACGRSGHPATWSVSFSGAPYDKKTLDDLESDDSDDEDDGGTEYDQDGNSLPPQDKQWFVGATCNSNAETAHNLTHWRYSLKDWVDNRLQAEGWLTADELEKREHMKPKKRRKLANQIVDDWENRDIVKNLFGDFKQNIEMAKEKPTTFRQRRNR